MQPERPTPEAMLARAAAEEPAAGRGRLKIFFGASPGVGKTYSMLEEAQARRRDGADVVIGWIETHGRAETERLSHGLERLPPRASTYRGIALRELDLDAALARDPDLLLVDELAHTNAEGSRHARRWQDVLELVDAGIDVATTLNVQHVESLNDVVAQITGVIVRETVPDSVIERADEVEFVDLGPDDLLERLREGKVYIPEQASRAMQSFFKKGNLIALRELALRRTAEHVDDEAHEWKRAHGVRQPWMVRERVLVAVGPAPRSANLIRAASRVAKRLRAPWIALSVETATQVQLSAEARERVAAHLQLAERLGAETLIVRGERVADEILAVARERNVTRIVVGKPTHARWRDRLRGSMLDELVRGSGDIDVLVTRGEGEGDAAPQPSRGRGVRRAEPAHYLLALAVVGLVTSVGLALRPWFVLADQAMLYLLGTLLVAARFTRGPSLLAAIASVAALDFFFVEPLHTFDVRDIRHVLTFGTLLVAGLFVSGLTIRIREQAAAARERERRTAALFAMSRAFMVATSPREIAETAMRHVSELLGAESVVLLGTLGRLEGGARTGDAADAAAGDNVARWVYEHGRPAGHQTDTLPGSEHLFLPLAGTAGPLGVFGIALGRRPKPLAPSQRQLLETMVAQTALALERAALADEAARARLAAETERTRNTLLRAVSHDLRSPLVSLRGAAEMLAQEGALDERSRRELLAGIRCESDRLCRLVEDLLELTRLESESVEVRKEWCPLEEIVVSALANPRVLRGDRRVSIELGDGLLMVHADPRLLEQVFVNLFENAVKYTPPDAAVAVCARREPGGVVIEVADGGPGLPAGEEERVFERFYRAPDAQRAGGTGLGLTICRAILKAHGGTIDAANASGGGAIFRMEIPVPGEPPTTPPEEPADGQRPPGT